MPDITKFIMSPDSVSADQKDRKLVLREWSRSRAEELALQERIRLTDAHWRVIEFLRAYYLEHGEVSSGRELARELDQAFSDQGGSRYLYRLFPEGPVAQGSLIAGLPIPPHTREGSFGSSM